MQRLFQRREVHQRRELIHSGKAIPKEKEAGHQNDLFW
jgi:hypothetical protein